VRRPRHGLAVAATLRCVLAFALNRALCGRRHQLSVRDELLVNFPRLRGWRDRIEDAASVMRVLDILE